MLWQNDSICYVRLFSFQRLSIATASSSLRSYDRLFLRLFEFNGQAAVRYVVALDLEKLKHIGRDFRPAGGR